MNKVERSDDTENEEASLQNTRCLFEWLAYWIKTLLQLLNGDVSPTNFERCGLIADAMDL